MIYHQGIPKFLWYTQVVAMTFNIDLTNCYQSLFYESTTQSLILVIPQEGCPSTEHQTALYLAQSYYGLNGYIPIVQVSFMPNMSFDLKVRPLGVEQIPKSSWMRFVTL